MAIGFSLRDNELSLRALEPSDLDWLYHLENETELWPVSETLTPFSSELLSNYIENAQRDIYSVKQLRLVIQHENHPVGLVDLFDFSPKHHRAMIGIVITSEFRRKGYAKRALRLISGYAKSSLDCHQLAATVAADNLVSKRLFESAGFTLSGVRTDWIYRSPDYIDEYFFQLIL
ncbi:MAG: hypothetical protein RLZZ242_1089 [Bacteroidota bacterium]